MRLSAHEVDAIRRAAAETFAAGTVVRLFGSRVDDSARGGDIDLHFEVDAGDQDIRKAATFRWRLLEWIDDQKVDLVFHVRGQPLRPIDQVAYDEGLVL